MITGLDLYNGHHQILLVNNKTKKSLSMNKRRELALMFTIVSHKINIVSLYNIKNVTYKNKLIPETFYFYMTHF
jgi:hypothetical protein